MVLIIEGVSHSLLMYPFSIPWNHQKTVRLSWVNQEKNLCHEKKNYLTYYHIKSHQQKKQAAPRIIKISRMTLQRKMETSVSVDLLTVSISFQYGNKYYIFRKERSVCRASKIKMHARKRASGMHVKLMRRFEHGIRNFRCI